MFVGHEGVGKTSLKRSLLGQKFVTEHLSTIGIDADPTDAKVEITHTTDWQQKGSIHLHNVLVTEHTGQWLLSFKKCFLPPSWIFFTGI